MQNLGFLKSLKNENIRKILFINFAVFFAFPLLMFFFIINHYNLLYEETIQIFFAIFLTYSLFGLFLLKKIIHQIIAFSNKAI